MPEIEPIKKLYYTIGEVAMMMGIEQHVLRFWESEFKELSPPKGKSGKRQYRPTDLEVVKTIKRLLYDEGYTIIGARKRLKADRGNRKELSSKADYDTEIDLGEIKSGLEEIRNIIDS